MVTLSILDLAIVNAGDTVGESLQNCVTVASHAERLGYTRIWYAEHHNMDMIASSATSVLIAHVAASTTRIRLGAGGVMLPNHSPLTIAEQFGTLACLHPGRIDLGLGRAPGTDQQTVRAMRRDPRASDSFPQDVVELQGYLSDETRVPGVNAIPGRGTHVPLTILGSSLYGATLAAALGLPFGFASHFAPQQLREAVTIYRTNFRPSEQLDRPHVIAGVNAIAADSEAEARSQLEITRRARVKRFFAQPGQQLTDEQAETILRSPQAVHVDQMLTHTALGTAPQVRDQLDEFATFAEADELMVVHQSPSLEARLRSIELTAEAVSARV